MVALVTFVMAATVVPKPSYASTWQLSDGFEPGLTGNWSCWNSVQDPAFVNGCNVGYTDQFAHGGTHASWIQGNSGWSDVGRPLSLSAFTAGRTLNCSARIWGRPLTFNTQLHGQLEVLDLDTWTYVAVQPFTLTATNDYLKWRPITTSNWVPPSKYVFVRIGLIGEENNELDALEVDDLSVSCQYS